MSNVNTKENVMLGSVVVIAVALMAIAGSAYGYLQSSSGVINEPIQNIGGLVHNQQETFDAGIAVNGTEVISSDRDGSFADLTITGSFLTASTLSFGVGAGTVATATRSVTTSTIATAGRTCLILKNNAGANIYVTLDSTGSLATSTVRCDQ